MIGSRRMMAAGGQSYLARALGTQPTYFWPLQGETDLTDVVSGEVLVSDGSAFAGVLAGPFGDDLCWDTSGSLGLKDADASINTNENTGSYSMGGWIYRVGTSTYALVGNYGGTMMYGSLTNQRLYHNGANVSFNPGLSNSTWHHIIQTYDASDEKIRGYVDGALLYTSTNSYNPGLTSATLFRIGGYGAGLARITGGAAAWCGWWVGKALSLSEVQTLAGI